VHFAIFGDWLTDPVFHWNGFSVTAAGVFALGACVVIGFSLAGFLQSNFMSRLLGRIGLDKKFFAIVRFVLSLFFVVGFIVLGLNFAGLAVPWEQQIPGLNLSLAQILRLDSWAGRREIPCEIVKETSHRFLVRLGKDCLLPGGRQASKGGEVYVPKDAVKRVAEQPMEARITGVICVRIN
jgi:hypothetical protein